MAILNRAQRTGTTFLALALALLASCVLLERLGRRPEGLAFSHKLHYVDEGLDCIVCHADYETADEPGMPVLAQCMLCHEEIDAERPPERRIASLFEGDKLRAHAISALSEEIVFSHRQHAADAEQCGSCHEGIEESERLDARMAVSMDECSSCHAREGVASECATCHSLIREDVAPPSHAPEWKRVHGRVVRSGSERTGDRCDLCHKESSCTACHLDEPPGNHTNHWRRRGHGITARMDRDSCAACHTSDSCDRCHAETRPLNHAGMWGSTRNRHCLACHIDTTEGGCFVCHQGTPSHSLAAPQPPSHTPGMNCLQCHGISAPLPHVTKGDDCTICHP